MANDELQGVRVAILVTDGFEQVEMEKPREALKEAGAETVLMTPEGGSVQGMNHSDKADKFESDGKIKDAKPKEFDAVLLPGGVANADKLRMDEDARKFVREMNTEGKPIAVICHGAWLLVSAGLVKGRELTSYYTLQDDIRNAGGKWDDQETVSHANWLSSRQPKDIPAFNRELLKMLGKNRAKAAGAK